jgi:hypothetical protein
MQGLRILWQVVFALDPLHACLALGPLGVYLSLIGALNLAGRPLIVSGTRDMAALGLAVSGFVIVGPLELCLPDAAAVRFGPYVWVLLLVFYALCLILALLLLRPRLVIYNVSADQLRAVLADLTDQLDSDARWAGDALALPRLGVQLHLDNVPLTRNVSLAAALGRVSIARNPRGAVFAAVGLAIILALAYSVACDPQAVAQALLEMLRI